MYAHVNLLLQPCCNLSPTVKSNIIIFLDEVRANLSVLLSANFNYKKIPTIYTHTQKTVSVCVCAFLYYFKISMNIKCVFRFSIASS